MTLSVLGSALVGIAEEMGVVLVRGAYSANVKERRDLSTALFDPDGRLVAQAAHIPVHLGAMPDAVAAVIARDPGPGDVFVLNDPFFGRHPPARHHAGLGRSRSTGRRCAYAVSRAHHSDVGGMRAGSIPPTSTEICRRASSSRRCGSCGAASWSAICSTSCWPTCARPGCAGRPARAARRRRGGPGAAGGARRPGAATRSCGTPWRASGLRRAALARAVGACPTACIGDERELEGDGITSDDLPIRVAVEIAAIAAGGLRRHRAGHARQRQLRDRR